MGSITTFEEIIERKHLKVSKKEELFDAPDVSAIKGGRVSVADNAGTIGGLLAELSTINPDFNIEILGAMETLAKYHGDFSYAVDNIKQLGNTKYNVYFDDSVSNELQKEMMLRIKAKSKNWYTYSGGINSMVGDLLAQIAIYGALSAENAILEDLSGVKKTIILNPKNIKFKYDKDKDEYTPYQQVRNVLGMGIGIDGNLIELNTETYKYIALGRFGEKPYGIPPFLSALENIAIGRDMQENLKYVVKKLGTLGFLEVLVNGPKPLPNEDADVYYKRTQDYLNKVIPEIDKGLSRGFVAGFKDVHEFNMHNLTSNVQGSKDLVEINDVKTMAGLKQDPLMFGRNFSTTETLGRVVLAKMTTQVGSYQKIVASYLESIFLTDLQLAGYPITMLDVEFDPPMVGDKMREEQTRGLVLDNLDKLLNKGIIDIYQYAQEAGYEKPADPEKHTYNPFLPEDGEEEDDPEMDDKEDATGDDDATDPKTTANNRRIIRALNMDSNLLYDYGVDCCPEHSHKESFDKVDSDLAFFIDNYYDATRRTYDRATRKAIYTIGVELSKMGAGSTAQEVYDAVLYHLYKDWNNNFKKPQLKVIQKFVEAAYGFFRKDNTVLKGVPKLPKAVFDRVDTRAMEYFKNSDDFYLGKFITDPDIRKKISKYIKEKHINGDLPIGNNREAMNAFREEFGGLMLGEDWKIQRIINTTTSKIRSTATVKYMEQAMVSEYEVRGITDRLQCGYCREMQGKRFKVESAVKHIEQFTISDPAYVPIDSPFVNSVFKNPEEIRDLSGEELQARGIHLTPTHPNCRCTLVAIL